MIRKAEFIMTEGKKKADCPCTVFDCPRHGDCEKCRSKHYAEGSKPKCQRKH
ncbi:hypothetical protein P0136_00900 [Lentisphaerota bacterium ZTH]|nr:hypothetical protein JYG24_07960 [Lentisphaerota bacterium]WET06571.1 hypothetical protein P0136_00900 [Lentisphaerota bacterium ZTH]